MRNQELKIKINVIKIWSLNYSTQCDIIMNSTAVFKHKYFKSSYNQVYEHFIQVIMTYDIKICLAPKCYLRTD